MAGYLLAGLAIIVAASLLFKQVTNFWKGIWKGIFGGRNEKEPRVYPNPNPDVNWNPMPLATELYNAMDGWSVDTDPKEAAWKKLAELEHDWQVVEVWKVFNMEYGNGTTLTQWITEEWGYLFGWPTSKDDALNRLGNLGLN